MDYTNNLIQFDLDLLNYIKNKLNSKYFENSNCFENNNFIISYLVDFNDKFDNHIKFPVYVSYVVHKDFHLEQIDLVFNIESPNYRTQFPIYGLNFQDHKHFKSSEDFFEFFLTKLEIFILKNSIKIQLEQMITWDKLEFEQKYNFDLLETDIKRSEVGFKQPSLSRQFANIPNYICLLYPFFIKIELTDEDQVDGFDTNITIEKDSDEIYSEASFVNLNSVKYSDIFQYIYNCQIFQYIVDAYTEMYSTSMQLNSAIISKSKINNSEDFLL